MKLYVVEGWGYNIYKNAPDVATFKRLKVWCVEDAPDRFERYFELAGENYINLVTPGIGCFHYEESISREDINILVICLHLQKGWKEVEKACSLHPEGADGYFHTHPQTIMRKIEAGAIRIGWETALVENEWGEEEDVETELCKLWVIKYPEGVSNSYEIEYENDIGRYKDGFYREIPLIECYLDTDTNKVIYQKKMTEVDIPDYLYERMERFVRDSEREKKVIEEAVCREMLIAYCTEDGKGWKEIFIRIYPDKTFKVGERELLPEGYLVEMRCRNYWTQNYVCVDRSDKLRAEEAIRQNMMGEGYNDIVSDFTNMLLSAYVDSYVS